VFGGPVQEVVSVEGAAGWAAVRRIAIRFAAVLVLAVLGCRQEPPRVALEGPEEVEPAHEAVFACTVAPEGTQTSTDWQATWVPDAAGQRPCEAEIRGTGARATLVVKEPCAGGRIEVLAKVEGRFGRATARRTARIRRVEPPAWPDPPPQSWRILNDYETASEPKMNRFGGAYGTWGFKGGKCTIEVAQGRLKVAYALPIGDSECGTFEYLKGAAGRPEPYDIRAFEAAAVAMRSADGREHRVVFEVVELDPYAAALQGYVAESPLWSVGTDWRRFEVRLDEILHPRFDRRMAKQVGLRIRRKDQDQASGVIEVEGIAWITPWPGRPPVEM